MANRVAIDAQAPEFELADWNGQTVRLSSYRGQKHVVLVFNRSFV